MPTHKKAMPWSHCLPSAETSGGVDSFRRFGTKMAELMFPSAVQAKSGSPSAAFPLHFQGPSDAKNNWNPFGGSVLSNMPRLPRDRSNIVSNILHQLMKSAHTHTLTHTQKRFLEPALVEGLLIEFWGAQCVYLHPAAFFAGWCIETCRVLMSKQPVHQQQQPTRETPRGLSPGLLSCQSSISTSCRTFRVKPRLSNSWS